MEGEGEMRIDELENIEDFAYDKVQYESGLSTGARVALTIVAIVVGMLFIVSTL